MVEILVSIISLLFGAGGVFAGGKIYNQYKKSPDTPQDTVSSDICALKHSRTDEKLDEISEVVQEIGKSVRRLETQQSRFLSMDGPIARIRKEVEEDLGEHIKQYHKAG